MHQKCNSILCFYLHDQEVEVRKWSGKPTSTLQAWVHNLQERTIEKRNSSREISCPVTVGRLQEREDGLILFLSSMTSLLGSTHEK